MSIDCMISDDPHDSNDFPVEFGMPQHILKLKVGAKKGLLNGTRLIVRSLHRNCIKAEIITGSNKGEEICIPRISLEPSERTLPFRIKRIQFPVMLVFAMTINNRPGQFFDHVGVYLREPVFAHGHLYLALTRERNNQKIKVLVKKTLNQGDLKNNLKIYTKNIVIK